MNDSSSIDPRRSAYGRNARWAVALLLGGGAVMACSADFEDVDSVHEALTTTASFRDGESSYSGTSDTYLREGSATSNFGSSTTCHADGDDGSGTDKYCLIRWNVNSIPAGAVVTSATITLRVVDGSSNTYGVYAMARSWNESEATWNEATSSTNWQTAGAKGSNDRGAQIGSVTGSTGSKDIALNASGVAMIQSWVDGGTNAGVIVASSSNTNGIDFASSEHGIVSYRPKLTVTYTTSDGSGAGATDPELLIAFIGDQGNNGNSDSVLNPDFAPSGARSSRQRGCGKRKRAGIAPDARWLA